jgi:phosphatidylserine/phosphatidylglycerophosphate/cardiolipin synthase-like enzyme
MLRAIAQARELIYIEEQYLTPPGAFRNAVVAKLTSGTLRRLVILVPGLNDQPFGEGARGTFVEALRANDPGGVVHVGYPRRRWTIPDNDLRASSGRLRLQAELLATGGIEQPILLGPKSRVPSPPFWLSIGGELMWVHRPSTAPSPDPSRIVVMLADRGAETRLVRGRTPEAGATLRGHSAGAAATVVDLTNIYVHSKMIIIDDVFLGVGSANLNRRGYCHDGEMNVYALPGALRADPANPVARLRRRLWAEALDLPLAAAEPLLQDPVAASALFTRSPFAGNRFVEIEALPKHVMFGSQSINGVVTQVLQGLAAVVAAATETQVFNTLSDPTSGMCTE